MAFMKHPAWQKEWQQLLKQEDRYIARHSKPRQPLPTGKLADAVPANLQAALDSAFTKAFELVFEKGTRVIEKSYKKAEHLDGYKVRRYAALLRPDKKSLRAFTRQARSLKNKNLLISGAERAGLGLLGVGLLEIPLFISLLLKSIYEVSLSFGFAYDSRQEQYFILRLVETALCSGDSMNEQDAAVNTLIYQTTRGQAQVPDLKEQTRRTAQALSKQLLFLKFIQGIPLVGAAGGIGNMFFLQQITGYAALKYHRRFLLRAKSTGTA